MISIRIANTNDAVIIADISRQTFIETFASHNSKENMELFLRDSFLKDKLIKEVGMSQNTFLLAYDNETPVGYVKLREDINPPELAGENAIEIARIYVIKSFIGKGVGRLLMQECVNYAIEKMKDILWLGVWEHNTMAIDFYIKWGFKKFSTQIFKLGNDNQIDWLMKKNIELK